MGGSDDLLPPYSMLRQNPFWFLVDIGRSGGSALGNSFAMVGTSLSSAEHFCCIGGNGARLGRAEVALSVRTCSSCICYALFWLKNCRRSHCMVWPSVRSSHPLTFFCGVASKASLSSASVGLPIIAPIASTKPVTPS